MLTCNHALFDLETKPLIQRRAIPVPGQPDQRVIPVYRFRCLICDHRQEEWHASESEALLLLLRSPQELPELRERQLRDLFEKLYPPLSRVVYALQQLDASSDDEPGASEQPTKECLNPYFDPDSEFCKICDDFSDCDLPI